jgi:hypothetical protein
MRMWTEYQTQRSLSTPEGMMFAYKDEHIVIAVCRNKSELAAVLAALTAAPVEEDEHRL